MEWSDELYREMKRYATLWAGEEEAEDLCQEAVARTWRHMAGAEYKKYLIMAVRNVWLDEKRREGAWQRAMWKGDLWWREVLGGRLHRMSPDRVLERKYALKMEVEMRKEKGWRRRDGNGG